VLLWVRVVGLAACTPFRAARAARRAQQAFRQYPRRWARSCATCGARWLKGRPRVGGARRRGLATARPPHFTASLACRSRLPVRYGRLSGPDVVTSGFSQLGGAGCRLCQAVGPGAWSLVILTLSLCCRLQRGVSFCCRRLHLWFYVCCSSPRRPPWPTSGPSSPRCKELAPAHVRSSAVASASSCEPPRRGRPGSRASSGITPA